MTPRQSELSVANVYQLRPAAETSAVVLDFPGQGLSAHDALDNALHPPLDNVLVHHRVTEIAAIQRRIKLGDTAQAIADRPDCDDTTRAEALEIYNGTQSYLRSTLGDKLPYNMSPSLNTQYETMQDYRDYNNTSAMSAALLDEQLPKSIVARDIVEAVDARMIIDICKQRVDFVEAHAEHSLRKKGQAFTKLLVSLDNMQDLIRDREDLPIANAATYVLTAKTLHDLALLGEFGKQDRDLAVQAAISELEKASDSINRAPANAVVAGIQQDIDWFLGEYMAEVSDGQMQEVSPAELPALIKHLGAAASLATVA